MLQTVTNDADVRSSARFLKIVALRVVTATLAFCMVGAGAYIVALVIHQIYAALASHSIELPRWAHESEVQATGAVIIILLILAMLIVAKDMWRVGVQGEDETAAEHQALDDSEYKSNKP